MGWGNIFKTIGQATGIGTLFGGQTQGDKALDSYKQSIEGAKAQLDPMYQKAKSELATGTQGAINTAKGGFQTARAGTTAGYGKAGQQLQTGGQEAIDTTRSGYSEAKGRYDAPEMVASRAELYNRILGKGGLSPEIEEQQKAKAREEYGTGMRGAMQGISQFQGDSAARGLAGENMARAATELGTNRANAVRDIGMRNAELARTEQTGAMEAMSRETLQRAGLDEREAAAVSDLQMKLAAGGADLTAQETNALANLASQEGITVADLQAKLAAGTANLTSEEAKALAEMTSGAATAGLQVGAQKNTFQGIFG
jgi:hypothetical protein